MPNKPMKLDWPAVTIASSPTSLLDPLEFAALSASRSLRQDGLLIPLRFPERRALVSRTKCVREMGIALSLSNVPHPRIPNSRRQTSNEPSPALRAAPLRPRVRRFVVALSAVPRESCRRVFTVGRAGAWRCLVYHRARHTNRALTFEQNWAPILRR